MASNLRDLSEWLGGRWGGERPRLSGVSQARPAQEKKKAVQEKEERDQALQAKASLAIPLVPETEEDRRLAALLKFHTLDCKWSGFPGVHLSPTCAGPCPSGLPDLLSSPAYEDKQRLKRSEISSRSWFPATPGSSASNSSSKTSSVLRRLAQGRRAGAPACTPITVGNLGIVRRRRSQDAPGSPPRTADAPTPQDPPQENPQKGPASPKDCPRGAAGSPKTSMPCEQEGGSGDRPGPPAGSSQNADALHPGCSSSLVADYSDSESSE